ncbi:hypothetical protein T8K17_04820 [Thalassobaculum sp. OXR-137]|uniref:hypothetical protein n=1 Tax=Thalassobaculum sp. OXR-137 TaxID=3100173 RepID=UPI002AC9AA67|nr:hypothetical protein [Thalassobaculum sp. OXR-137]WPZ35468.1 hypothetical protein T8K17_04820 [Thalassobaculum sp. OXR-137]
MSVTEATGQANPSWWSQKCQSGEADPCEPGTGGTNDSFGFADLLDVINPLQHIPVVSTLYRELTGDTISETARMAGGALWGGPAGVIGALANTITEGETGSDIGGTAMAYLRGEEVGTPAQDPAAMLADASQAAESGDPLAGPVPASVAAFADAAQPATPGSVPAAQAGAMALAAAQAGPTPAGSQEFSGSAASRLDAFIQRANAVRTPALTPARTQAADPAVNAVQSAPGRGAQPTGGKGLVVDVTPSAAAQTAPARSAQAPAGAPLTLATGGNTDVANWMSRALDRYESMKTREQS